MNNIEEAALKTDLGRLKGAHNNLVNKTQGDIAMLVAAVKQCVEAVTKLEQRVGAIEQRLSAVVTRPTAVPQVPTPRPMPAPAPPPAPEVSPSEARPFSWPEDGDEEDGELVE